MQPDGQPAGTPHMYHRGNAKHPAFSSNSGCTSGLQMCHQQKLQHSSACVLEFLWMWVTVNIHIFTQSTYYTFVPYNVGQHVSMYITKWAVAEATGLWWKNRRSKAWPRTSKHNQPLRAAFYLERHLTSMKLEEWSQVNGRQANRRIEMVWRCVKCKNKKQNKWTATPLNK